jgi:hypothetical protein
MALAAIVGCIIVAVSVQSAFTCKLHPGKKRFLAVLGYSLVAFGALGFFGLMFSSLGGLRWLSADLDWPVGFVRGTLTLPDGTHVVPVELAGTKIQVYTPDWRFLRAWYVPAGGRGQFHLQLAQTNRIEVITRRNAMQYLYDVDGSLISAQSYAPKRFADFARSAESSRVPTPWWLWMFISPMRPWIIFALGGVLVFFARRGAADGSLGAQPGTPNRDPAMPSSNSGVTEGPPSVS